MPRLPVPGEGGELALPSGEPASIRAAATRFRQASGRALATAGVRGNAAAELSLAWQGAAAEQATGELATVSGRARRVLPQLEAGARALDRYADALEHAVRRTTALRAQAADARHEHARLVAATRATATDPLTTTAAVERADHRLADDLATTHQAHARELADLRAAGAACARELSGLASTAVLAGTGQNGHGATAVRASLLGGLPLAQEQIRLASIRPVGHTTPRREQTWYETAFDNVANAGAWTYNHTAVPVVNGAADVAQAAIEHPEDLAQMALGTGMMFLGGGGQVGGVALDSTAVGAVAGVPIHVAAAGLISTGAITAGRGASDLAKHAAAQDSMLLKKVELKTGSRGHGGDPLPDSMRPANAGANWKGRIANNGNGEVWQAPEHVATSIGTTSCKSCLRIMDPKKDYDHGYVRFYNRGGQPLRLDGRTGTEDQTHVAIRSDGTYDIPKGWSPR